MARRITKKLSKEQVPSLLYKIRDNFTKEEFIAQQKAGSEVRDTLEIE